MKFSTLQLLAIVFCLALGFMTVAPFVQKVDADGDSHSYTVTVTQYRVHTCTECSVVMCSTTAGSYEETRTHPDGGGHCSAAGEIVEATAMHICYACEASS